MKRLTRNVFHVTLCVVPIALLIHAHGAVHAASEVTWRRQIAPIVYTNCTSCHHEGGSGPFALSSYNDARRWGKLMQTVTASRYMPPWLPVPSPIHFQGDRHLADEDIALIAAG